MLLIIYKILRRIIMGYRILKIKLRINYYKILYTGKIYLEKNSVYGNAFSLRGNLKKFKLLIGSRVYFMPDCIIRVDNSNVVIGNDCFFNRGCSINSFLEISIGDNCLFGEGVKLYDHNHNYRNPKLLIRNQGYSLGAIKIGNNCWISSNTIILKNVVIGDNVVIGAGCIIYKSIPSNSVIVQKQNLTNMEVESLKYIS